MNKSLLFTIVFFLIGCSPLQHKTGEKFYFDIWTKGNNPTYSYGGEIYGNKFFYRNNQWILKDTVEFGVMVNGDTIVKSLNQEETEKIKSDIASLQQNQNRQTGNISERSSIQNNRVEEQTKKSLSPAELKRLQDAINALNKSLNNPSGIGNSSSQKNVGNWCVKVQPKENCEVSNIRSVGSPGNFQFSTRCVSRYGSSGSSGIGEVNCNNQAQWNSTNYSAHCYKC